MKWSRIGQKVKVRSRIENVNLDHLKSLILLYFITYFYYFSLKVKVNRYKVSRKKNLKIMFLNPAGFVGFYLDP